MKEHEYKVGDKVVFNAKSERFCDDSGVYTVEVVTGNTLMLKGLLFTKDLINLATTEEIKAGKRLS